MASFCLAKHWGSGCKALQGSPKAGSSREPGELQGWLYLLGHIHELQVPRVGWEAQCAWSFPSHGSQLRAQLAGAAQVAWASSHPSCWGLGCSRTGQGFFPGPSAMEAAPSAGAVPRPGECKGRKGWAGTAEAAAGKGEGGKEQGCGMGVVHSLVHPSPWQSAGGSCRVGVLVLDSL